MKPDIFLYSAWQLLRMHLQPGYRVPLSIYIVLTYQCNNHCSYCRVHDISRKEKLSTEVLKAMMSEMKRCGVRRVHFTGGEPMVRGDMGKLIGYAKRSGLMTTMVTNGYQVSERINELRDLDVVLLSYDGPPQVHARLRGEKSTKDVASAFDALKGAGIRTWLSTTLTRYNVGCIDEIVRFAKENGTLANFNCLEFFYDSPGDLHPHISEVKDLALSREERKHAFRKLIQLKRSGAPIGSSLGYLQNAIDWPFSDRITDAAFSKSYQCWAGRAYGHLEADGNLYACGYGALRRELGVSVLDQGFRSAWKNLLPLKNCNSCSHACGVENNLLFSLDRDSIFNALDHFSRS